MMVPLWRAGISVRVMNNVSWGQLQTEARGEKKEDGEMKDDVTCRNFNAITL